MLLICGKGLFGRVDRVDGDLQVATRCYHIFWIPIIPIETVIIPIKDPVDEIDNDVNGSVNSNPFFSGASISYKSHSGIKIPFSFKSWLVGLITGPLTVAGFFGAYCMLPMGCAMGFYEWFKGTVSPQWSDLIEIPLLILLFLSPLLLLGLISECPGIGKALSSRRANIIETVAAHAQ